MPDLDQARASAWFADWQAKATTDLPRADWPPAIRPVEVAGDTPVRLAALGTALDAAIAVEDEDDMQGPLQALSDTLRREPVASQPPSAALAQLGAARTLRILHWLTEADLPDGRHILSTLLRHDSADGRALRALVQALRRKAVLSRIFAPERLAALEIACTESLLESA